MDNIGTINHNTILDQCKLFFLEDQEYGDIKLIIYEQEEMQDSTIILFIGEQYHVITNSSRIDLTKSESKKVKIAQNLHLYPQHFSSTKDEVKRIVFKQNKNLRSFPELCNCIVEIISELNKQ